MRGIDRKRAMTAATTLCIAAAAGFFMQQGTSQPGHTGVAPLPQGASQTASQPEQADVLSMANLAAPSEPIPVEVSCAQNDPIVAPSSPVLPVATPEITTPKPTKPEVLAALDTDLPDIPDVADATPNPVAQAPDCEVGFTLTSTPAAMVSITLEAPCHAGDVVEFFHAGMRFNEQLDENGLVQVAVPALEENATFAASFPDGETVGDDILMPTLSGYERVALIWQGDTGLGLHALEGAATYGDDGHIWARATGHSDRATAGTGGFLTVLGNVDGGWAADVYTYPAANLGNGSDPVISIEAEVLDTTCAAPVRGTYMHVVPTGQPVESALSFGAVGCDAVGEFLVLKNLPQDLKIARN